MNFDIQKIIKYFKTKWVGWLITFGAIIIVSISHWLGFFDTLELKTYDYRFNSIRGPLTGWSASDSTYIKKGTDIEKLQITGTPKMDNIIKNTNNIYNKLLSLGY